MASQIRNIVSGSTGNLIEWYDWYTYAAFSLYFAPLFFQDGNETAKMLNAAGIFAIGFLMRPVGAWFFGRLADRKGRKFSMTIAVILMCGGSLIIAVSPSYETIGIFAPILLTFARLLQGFSLGGEYGTVATYLSEIGSSKNRGFFTSFQYVTLIGGQLTALGIQLLLQAILSVEQLHEWGWRIPFYIGAALALVSFYLRSHMDETSHFKKAENLTNKSKGSLKELLKHKRAFFVVVGLTMGGTTAFYTYTTYMQKFLVLTVHFSKEQATRLTFFALLFFALIQPIFGWLSDRIGRKPILLGFGILGTLFTIPILTGISTASGYTEALILNLIALVIVTGYTSINAIVKAELFPTTVRALGVGLPYALAMAIFAGSTEWIALYFKHKGHESYFYYYVTTLIFLSLIVYAFMKDTKKTSLIE